MELFPNGSADPSWFETSTPNPVVPPQPSVDEARKEPDQFAIDPDITAVRIPLSVRFEPEVLDAYREGARYGQLVAWYSALEELQRCGIAAPIGKLRALAQGADYTLVRNPEDDGDEDTTTPAYLQELSKEVHEYVEDDLLPHLPDLFAETLVDGAYYGISAAIPHDDVRGYRRKYPSLREIEQVPSRLFDYSTQIKDFRLLAVPGEQTFYSVNELRRAGKLLFYETNRGKPLDQRGFGHQLFGLATMYEFCLQYWMEDVQDFGSQIFEAIHADNDKRGELLANKTIRAVAHNLRVAHGKSVELKLLGARDAVRGQLGGPHQQLIEFLEREASKIVLGHDAASGDKTGTGSRTGGVKASEDTDMTANAFLRRGARFVERNLIAPRVRRAFGQKAFELCVPHLIVKVQQTPDFLMEAQVVKLLREANYHLRPGEVAKRTNYSVVEKGNYVGKMEDEQQVEAAKEKAADSFGNANPGAAPASKHPNVSRFPGGDKVGSEKP